MSKLLVLDGSYRADGVTSECLHLKSIQLARKHDLTVQYIHIDGNIAECKDCRDSGGIPDCIKGCRQHDQLRAIIAAMEHATHILIGTPVYLDSPTAKVMALLHRLNCMAEPTGREFFAGKKIYLHANGYVSGTKAAIGAMMHACEMLGFDIPGRSTSEYIEKWKDNKIRGGMSPNDACWLSGKP